MVNTVLSDKTGTLTLSHTNPLSAVAQGMVNTVLSDKTGTLTLSHTNPLSAVAQGMVNTVLSDKTGTLTRNVMEFFKCSIAGKSYGAGVTEIERANAARHGHTLVDNSGDPNFKRVRN